MPLLWLDGFETYQTNNFLQEVYGGAFTGTLAFVTGHHGGKGLTLENGKCPSPAIDDGNVYTHLCIGYSQKFGWGDVGGERAELFLIYSGALNVQFSVFLVSLSAAEEQVYFEIVDANGVVLGTSTFIPKTTVWGSVEIHAFCDDTAGTVEIRWDGLTILRVEDVDTDPSTDGNFGRVIFEWDIPADMVLGIDNFYVMLANGAPEPLGDIHVTGLLPAADVSKQFTPQSGTDNYATISDGPTEATPDADYNQATAAGQQDTFTVENPRPLDGDIKAVEVRTRIVGGAAPSEITPEFDGSALDPIAAGAGLVAADSVPLAENPTTVLPWEPADLREPFGYQETA